MADDDRVSDERFQATMTAISKHFEHEDFEAALPLCAKAAEVRPNCPVVRRSRVFALLSLSRWAEALQACEKLSSDEDDFCFEKAYCHYRLNQCEEALKLIREAKSEEDSDRFQRLEAQVCYRMGEYVKCAEMYEKLYLEDDEESGLLVNALAAHVSGDQPRLAIKAVAEKQELLESSYELCFNLACAYLDENRTVEAEERLEEAKKICMAELLEAEEDEEEGEGKDPASLENHEELASIHVQQATVLQSVGGEEQLKEANEIYTRVLKPRSGNDGQIDTTVLAVACNNLVALRPEGKNLFDSLKRLNVASKESWEQRLTHKQSIEISINKCLLLLQTRKLEQAKAELQKLKAQFKDHPRVAVAQAAVAFREKKAKGAEEVLQAYLAEHPDSEDTLICLAQLHAQQNRFDKAVEALESMSKASRVKPTIAEVVVSFHLRQKNPDKAVACLREAIDYWSGKDGEEDEDTLAQVLKMSSKLAIQLKDKSFAAEAYQLYLERADGSDVEALCGLVQALAVVDPERAEQYAQRLTLPDYGHLDAEDLENGSIPKFASAIRKGAEAEDKTTEDKAKKKKKRKPRYPKGFDPENPGPPPDPERWLPKYERSEYKKKMRKRDKNLARGPQGAMVTDEKAFRKTGPSTAQMEVQADPNMTRPKGTRNKKGGKK